MEAVVYGPIDDGVWRCGQINDVAVPSGLRWGNEPATSSPRRVHLDSG